MNVYHAPHGVLFRKLEGEEGISYIAVDLEEVGGDLAGLLVRHGNPDKGCGYYPASLIMADETKREKVAQLHQKRKPSERWVNRMQETLKEQGIVFH